MIEPTDKLSDKALVRLVMLNHRGATAEFIHRYERMVFNLALNLLGNYHDAEEVAQDTFIKAIRSINSFRADSQLSTWVYRICYNTCITQKRKRRLITTEIDCNKHDAMQSTEENEHSQYLQKAMESLCEDDRTIISLFYVDEMPTSEIASVVELSESNVRVKLHRARKKLKEMLHHYSKINELTHLR
jgi:RNA polymerase sigma-70 factor (ECF subfamily)